MHCVVSPVQPRQIAHSHQKKAEFRMDMSYRIAIDCGHGFVKGLMAYQPRLLMPSLIVSADESPDTGRMVASESLDRVQWTGQPQYRYRVGDTATLDASSLFSRNKAQDRLTRDLTVIAVDRLLPPEVFAARVQLAVGLPLTWFHTMHQAVADSLTGDVRVNQRQLRLHTVVFPQGIAAVLAVIPPGSPDGLYGVLDVGYRTVDFLIVEVPDHAPPRLMGSWAGTVELGIAQAMQPLSNQINDQWQVDYAPHELATKTTITVRGKQQSIQVERQKALSQWQERVTERIQTVWAPILSRLQSLIVVGGAASIFAGTTIGTMPVTIAPESQWANVQGYLQTLESGQ